MYRLFFIAIAKWFSLNFIGKSHAETHENPSLPVDVSPQTISEKDVLDSIQQYHPQIMEARAKIESAQGEIMKANGAFDPVLSLEGKLQTGAYYELRTLDAQLKQPTPFWGIELWVNYRLGLGVDPDRHFPTYSNQETLAQGELRGGLVIPLWRGGLIDERRAQQTQSVYKIKSSQQKFQAKILQLKMEGILSFWKWVSWKEKTTLIEKQIELLEKRQKQLIEKNLQGAISSLSLIENERALLSQKNSLLQYQQELMQAEINLSLFLRDSQGQPWESWQILQPEIEQKDQTEPLIIESLISCQPEIQALQNEISVLETELQLAENQIAPKANIYFDVSRDFGNPNRNPSLAGTVFEAKASFEMPLLLRQERGKANQVAAEIEAKRRNLQWIEERTVNRIEQLNIQLKYATQRYEQTQKLQQKAEELARAEMLLLESGASDLLRVNIRDQFSIQNRIQLTDAKYQVFATQGIIEQWKTFRCSPS